MSYCRWSSDDFGCDVYVYEDIAGGWITHVATKRFKSPPLPIPKECFINGVYKYGVSSEADALWEENKKRNEALLEDINSSMAGKSFSDPTPGDCAGRLESLRDEGFNVPQYVIDALREEQNEIEEQKNL